MANSQPQLICCTPFPKQCSYNSHALAAIQTDTKRNPCLSYTRNRHSLGHSTDLHMKYNLDNYLIAQ